MASLKDSLELYISLLGKKNERVEKLKRCAQVNLAFKKAVEQVYKESSKMVLSHINAVYIVSAEQASKERIKNVLEKNETVLIIYCDDSLIRSDIDARQEFLKVKLKEQKEQIGAFVIKPSRFEMKNRHPFKDCLNNSECELHTIDKKIKNSISLSQEENEIIYKTCNQIKDKKIRVSVKKAMISDIKRKKSFSDKNIDKSNTTS